MGRIGRTATMTKHYDAKPISEWSQDELLDALKQIYQDVKDLPATQRHGTPWNSRAKMLVMLLSEEKLEEFSQYHKELYHDKHL